MKFLFQKKKKEEEEAYEGSDINLISSQVGQKKQETTC